MKTKKEIKGALLISKAEQKSIIGGKTAPITPELCECYTILYNNHGMAIGWMPNSGLSASCQTLCS